MRNHDRTYTPSHHTPLTGTNEPTPTHARPTMQTVLQREPEISAVYGAVFGGTGSSTKVSVTVTDTLAPGSSYTVTATLTPGPVSDSMLWKALLKPHAAGGNVTITAGCSGCANTTHVDTVQSVTFGDVFFCSGQRWESNVYCCHVGSTHLSAACLQYSATCLSFSPTLV